MYIYMIYIYIYDMYVYIYVYIYIYIRQKYLSTFGYWAIYKNTAKICLQQNANQLDDSIRFHDAVHFDDWIQFVANDVVAQQFQNATSWPDQQI